MKARILNFRGSYKQQQGSNQMIVLPEGVTTKAASEKLVGKKIVWTNTKGNSISGKVSSVHGRNGAVRAIFEKGMPGQSLGTEAKIE
jgi:large subunit ribosomal protein L35Ae